MDTEMIKTEDYLELQLNRRNCGLKNNAPADNNYCEFL